MELMNNTRRPRLQGSYLVVFVLSKIVTQLFGEKCGFVPQSNGGKRPLYPYVTFNHVYGREYTTSDNRSDQYMNQFQVDYHDPDENIAEQNASDLLDALLNDKCFQRWFGQVNVVPTRLQGSQSHVQNHTVLAGINYDNAFGFYLDFQISHADTIYKVEDLDFKYELPIIESIHANGSADRENLNINQKKEEYDGNSND